MRQGQRLARIALFCLIGTLALTGCARKVAKVPPAQAQQNHETAQQFIAALQAVTPDQRVPYVQAHQSEAKVAFENADPAVRMRLQELLSEK